MRQNYGPHQCTTAEQTGNNTLRGCAVTGHQDGNTSKYAKKADRNV